MAKTWRAKDPDDVADYGFDWSPQIAMGDGPNEDPIVSTTAVPTMGGADVDNPDGLAVDEAGDHGHFVGEVEGAPTGQATVTWLKGGIAGTNCEILLRIVTEAGRKFDQTMKIKIKER
jgi:hypothetical protein